jgi:hypothetical protein
MNAMKMKLFATLLLAMGITYVNARQSQFFVKGGLNIANVSTTNDGRIEDANALASFHVGLMGDFALSKNFSIQPSLLFTGKGAKTESGNTSGQNYVKATTNPYYVELPVNLVLKLPFTDAKSNFFVGAGPYLGMGVAGKNKVEGKVLGVSFSDESSIDFSNDDPTTGQEEGAGFGIMRRFDYGFNGTAGLQLNNVLLSVNYGHGLAKLQSGSNNSEDDKNKHRVVSFTIGFRL